MQSVLITGGSGFIGRNLIDWFSDRYSVVAPSRDELDLLDPVAVSTYLREHKFDCIIHGATERSNRALPANSLVLDHNCRMFFNIARNESFFGRMLFLSSGSIYDRSHTQPQMQEDYFDRYVPQDEYAFSKYICAKSLGSFNSIYELRLFGVFGRHEDWRVRFISNACCRAVWDMPVLLRQNVVFDYLDVEDLARILDAFMGIPLSHRYYNVCSGRRFPLTELAEIVVQVSRKDIGIRIVSGGLGREYTGDNARMLSVLPSFKFRDITKSVSLLYEWYRSRKIEIDPAMLRFDEPSTPMDMDAKRLV